jgi:Holliday junction resolvase
MPNYARGANFERRVVAYLRERKWVAARTAGSHGSFDIVAARYTTAGKVLLFMQLKMLKKRRNVSREERAALLRDANEAGADAVIVRWKHGGFEAFWAENDSPIKPLFFEPPATI